MKLRQLREELFSACRRAAFRVLSPAEHEKYGTLGLGLFTVACEYAGLSTAEIAAWQEGWLLVPIDKRALLLEAYRSVRDGDALALAWTKTARERMGL